MRAIVKKTVLSW